MDHAAKLAFLTLGRDLSALDGLEIGARDAPLVPRSLGRVLYADYADTATLRAGLQDPTIDPATLVEVDLVTGGGSLAAVAPHAFDYVIASHVIEHVPDLLGWLADLREILRPGGTIGLAIPDRRFTFDRFRRESTIAEAVEAYLLGLKQPSLRQVFDSCWQAVEVSVPQGWANDIPAGAQRAQRLARLAPALRLVAELRDAPRYNDAHCWVFTPASFLELIEEAAQAGLFQLYAEAFTGTERDGYEFYVVLRRAEADEQDNVLHAIRDAQARLQGSAPEAAFAAAHAPAETAALRQENAALRAAVEEMRNATLWRATAPVRRLADALRRR